VAGIDLGGLGFVQGSQQDNDVTMSMSAQFDARRALPPGQRPAEQWRIVHYGPVPRRKVNVRWDITIFGATASGEEVTFDLAALAASGARQKVRADLHCVSGFSVMDLLWEGIPTSALLSMVPPRADVRYVMAWAEYGYSANLPFDDFAAPTTLIATHVNDEVLAPDRGGPARLVLPHLYAWKGPKWLRGVEYLTEDRRGFWEERGYHNVADPWAESRYSYQESSGDGPPL
jgi:DMSO/TMAO reductase YedYZ molybdopterin-dependent catalytic subunit